MPGPDVPSYAQLFALVEVLRAENARLAERVAELEARLGQNSRNSSKPPSSEGLGKSSPRSLRRRSVRKPGGQAGHDGTTLMQVGEPDHEVVHEPGCCAGCGRSLAGRPVTGVERRQQFDLPPLRVEVTEHRLVDGNACADSGSGESGL